MAKICVHALCTPEFNISTQLRSSYCTYELRRCIDRSMRVRGSALKERRSLKRLSLVRYTIHVQYIASSMAPDYDRLWCWRMSSKSRFGYQGPSSFPGLWASWVMHMCVWWCRASGFGSSGEKRRSMEEDKEENSSPRIDGDEVIVECSSWSHLRRKDRLDYRL